MREEYVNFVLCNIECKHIQMGFARDFSVTKHFVDTQGIKVHTTALRAFNAVVWFLVIPIETM
jgi:hypothetical protein